jgi:hypothetical protein
MEVTALRPDCRVGMYLGKGKLMLMLFLGKKKKEKGLNVPLLSHSACFVFVF